MNFKRLTLYKMEKLFNQAIKKYIKFSPIIKTKKKISAVIHSTKNAENQKLFQM